MVMLAGSSAYAQDPNGGGGGGGQSAPSPPRVTSSGGGGGGGGPDAIYGLREPAGKREVLPFESAMALALANNPDLRGAQERLAQADLFIRKAWSAVLPRLNASVGYQFSWPEIKLDLITQEQLDAQTNGTRAQLNGQAAAYDAQAAGNAADGDYNSEQVNRTIANQYRSSAASIPNQTAPDPINISPAHVGNGALNFQFILFNGRAIPLVMNAYDGVNQARLSISRARMQVLYMVAVTYFGAVSARKLEDISRRQVERLEAHLGMVQARVRAETLTELALRRAEADVTRARAGLRNAHNAYETAVAALGVTLGLREAFDVGELPMVPALEEQLSEQELVDRAMRRSDVQAAQIGVTMADREKWDALARWLPVLSLNGSARATTNVSGFQREPLTYAMVLNLSVPLYDGGERYVAWEEAQSRGREARISMGATRDRVEAAVLGNLREISIKKANLENYRQSVELAQRTQRQAELMFQAGVATQLDVMDAQQLLLATELELSQAEQDLHVARMGLAHVAGLFDPAVEPTNAASGPVIALDVPPRGAPVGVAAARAPVAPPLAPAGRRGVASGGRTLSLQPSAVELSRHAVSGSRGAP